MITARSWRSSRGAVRSAAVLVALVAATQAGGAAVRHALEYDRFRIAHGELWRLATGSFVHLGWTHWLLDALGVVALVALCPEMPGGRAFVQRLLALSVAMSAALYVFAPHVDTYVGLSGPLHGLFLLGLWPAASRRDPVAIACLTFLAAKLARETVFGAPVSEAAAIGGRVVTESHLFGTLAAFVYGLFAHFFRKKPER